jgi:hypothetical protein
MTVRLEDLQPDAQVRGLMGREAVRIVSAVGMGDLEFVSGGLEHIPTRRPQG